jgi:hypothetical protein
VVDDHDDFLAREALPADGLHGGARLVPPLHRVRADDYGNQAREGSLPVRYHVHRHRPADRAHGPAGRFRSDRLQDPPAVGEDAEVALPVHPRPFLARYLLHPQPGFRRADVHDGLDLEAVAVQVECGQVLRPERVTAVAQVGVLGADGQVDQPAEGPSSRASGPV